LSIFLAFLPFSEIIILIVF